MGSDSKSPLPATSSSWIRSELDKKANREWVEATLKPIESTTEEAKTIALAAKRSWGKWTIGGGIALVLLISAVLANYFSLKDSVEDTQDEMVEVKDEVVMLSGEVQKVKVIVEDDRKRQAKMDKKQLEQIKSAIRDSFQEVRADIQPDPPRRRNR